MESHFRSILKAITWRAGGTVVTAFVAWIFTDSLDIAARIGILDSLIKIAAFYFHERFWIKLNFGKLKQPEYQI
jgi:bifunctional enzyme CysN/CysC/sulfate adenylyltransferase subunit 1